MTNDEQLDKLQGLVEKIDDLPTLPRTVLRITELVNNPSSSAKDLAAVITEDQVLTARLLRLVNSSFYGFPQKISTVSGAVVLLGFDAIRHLLLTTSVFDLFAVKNHAIRAKQEQLWDHSLGCAVGAKIIGTRIGHDNVEELFVAGLLHDIGKIVQMIYLPDDYSAVVSLTAKENIHILAAETRLLDYTHAELGRLLATRWNLAANLEDVIAHHHTPEQTGRPRVDSAVIHLADIMCRALNMGSGGDNCIPALNQDAWTQLDLKTKDIDAIMTTMQSDYADIHRAIN